MSFGQKDELLRGDDKTSATLKSPITIYAGDGLEGGFTFVRVRFYDSLWDPNNQSSAYMVKMLLWFKKVLFENPKWKILEDLCNRQIYKYLVHSDNFVYEDYVLCKISKELYSNSEIKIPSLQSIFF